MLALRLRMLLPALWAGMLLCIALMATPAPFATLAPADAGRVVGRIFAEEAYVSIAIAVLLFLLERRVARAAGPGGHGSVVSTTRVLRRGPLVCPEGGEFAIQPMMVAARAGQGAVSFAALHGVSMGFFALKILLVCSLAWRVAKPA